ncbi:MAG: hypothetical protein WBB25_08615 [Sulfitobacter sp.]
MKVTGLIAAIYLVCLLPLPAVAEFRAPTGSEGNWVRQIGLGHFELARGATRNEQEVIAHQTRRLKLMAFIYHDVFDGMCPVNGPARKYTQRIDQVTRTYTGQETDRIEGSTNSVTVRSQYTDVFSEGYAMMGNPAGFVLSMGANFGETLVNMATASRDVIRLNGCGSAELDMFERNLAALVRGQPSLQAQGKVQTLMETQCLKTDIAGLGPRARKPAREACPCMAKHLWAEMPQEWLARLEDGFTRERFLGYSALTPEIWNGVSACLK